MYKQFNSIGKEEPGTEIKMKSLTSKGKSKSKRQANSTLPQPKVDLVKRGKRTRHVHLPKQQIGVNYLHRKVVFNISQLEPLLVRAIMRVMADPTYRPACSSLLMQLRPMWLHSNAPFFHVVSTLQAVTLITHLLRKRRGDANVMVQFQELDSILKSYTLESKDTEGELEEERLRFNSENEQLRKSIKAIYVGLKEQLKDGFVGSEDYHKVTLLEWKIRQLGGKLLDLTIVAIKEIKAGNVDVLFEHCYPDRTCPQTFLKEALGESRYIAKKINFARHTRTGRVAQSANNNFILCHVCKQVVTGEYFRCSNTPSKTFTATVHNSPSVHERHFLSFDYQYAKGEKLSEEELQLEMDYFKYSELEDRPACNRILCDKCQSEMPLSKLQSKKKFTCPFCLKDCRCQACITAKELVEALALYKHILKRNYQPFNKFTELLKFVNLDHPSVELFPRPRRSFIAPPKRQFKAYYQSLLQEFNQVNQTMIKFQGEAVRCAAEIEEFRPIITEYMIQVRQFALSVRQQHLEVAKPTSRKSLAKVREYNKREEQRASRLIDAKEEEMIMELLNPANQTQERKLVVPFAAAVLTKLEMFTEETDQQQQPPSTGTQLQPSDIKGVSALKQTFPFSKAEYKLSKKLKPECKIIQQRDLILNRAFEEGIIFPKNHPDYVFRSDLLCPYYDNDQEFIDQLEESEESEEEEGVIEDLETPEVGSVSISSFLDQQANKKEFQVAQDIREVSECSSANSSLIIFNPEYRQETTLQTQAVHANEDNGGQEDDDWEWEER